MEQMDRLFRKSNLTRDKWDRPQSGSTYSRLTLKKAISDCSSFYGQTGTFTASADLEVFALDSDEDTATAFPACVDSYNTSDNNANDTEALFVECVVLTSRIEK